MRMGIIQPENCRDRHFSNYIIAYMVISVVNLFVKNYLGGIVRWELVSRGVLALFLVQMLISLIRIRKINVLLVLEALTVFLYLFSLVLGNVDNSTLLSSLFEVTIVFIPLGISAFFVEEIDSFLSQCYIWSWICVVLLSVMGISSLASGIKDYSMAVGYAMLLPTLFIIDHFKKHKKLWDILGLVWAMAMILLFGSRGPLLCIVAFILLSIIESIDLKNKKKLAKSCLWIILLIVLVVFHKWIIEEVLNLFLNRGISSRSIDLLLYDITHDSGRTIIYNYYWNKVLEKPILGWGIHGGWTYGTGIYPHNVFLELMLSFGIVLGVAFSALLIYVFLKVLFIKNVSRKSLAVIIISSSISLLFSDSFIQSYVFFLCLGICFRMIKDNGIKENPKLL